MELSPLTERNIAALFAPSEHDAVRTLLWDGCRGDSPSWEQERIHCAMLRVSKGRMDRLERAVETAKGDWRDVLLRAGFADDPKAHLRWVPGKFFFAVPFLLKVPFWFLKELARALFHPWT